MSEPTTILVVENNPATLKMIRLALSAEGYRVLEAENGAAALELCAAERPAAVLLDLILPDSRGFEMLAKLRACPGGTELPVIAVTGFLTGDDQARTAAAGFDQILIKPIDASLLVEVVSAYAHFPQAAAAPHFRGKRVLLVDDDPVQRKLARLRLMCLGFEVDTAADGVEALAAARSSPPDAIVSDVLMPRLDGFKLYLAIRGDPVLGRTPMVLQSNKFTGEADRLLARKVGANAYVERDPGGSKVAKALLASLNAAEPPPFESVASDTYSEYSDRIVRQLERQVAMNDGLIQRNIRLASEVAVLGRSFQALQSSNHQLRESEERFGDLAGAMEEVFFLVEKDMTRVLYVSPAYERVWGRSCQTLYDRPLSFLELVHPDDLEYVRAVVAEIGKRSGTFEYRLVRDDGSARWIRARVFPVRNERGEIYRAAGVAEDVTALKEANAEDARLAAIVGASEDAIIGKALDGTVESWNRGAERQYGYSAAEMIGQPVSRIIPSERIREIVDVNKRILRGESVEPHESERVHKDGKRITVSLTSSPILDSAGRITGIATIARNVTERKAAEEALRQRERLLDGLFEASPAGMAILDRDFRYLRINGPLARMNGLTVEQHLGRTVREIIPKMAPMVEADLRHVWATSEPILDVEISGETPRFPGVLRHWTQSYFPIPDEAGRPVALGAVILEVTELKEAAEKLRLAMVKAQESDRLKTAFLANMSHEVRTPLNVILGYNAVIAEQLADLHDETLNSSVEAVSAAGYRLLQTVQGIIDLSRLESETFEVRPAPLALTPMVDKAVRQFRVAAEKKRLSLVCEIEVPDAEVQVDEYCLRQVLHHILDNAIKFTKEGGITVRLQRDPHGDLCLTVRDTGVGIDPGYVPSLFKPFSQEEYGFTRSFEGPGIGLALAKRFLDLIPAEIAVRSAKNEGTTVTIRFAKAAGSAGRA